MAYVQLSLEFNESSVRPPTETPMKANRKNCSVHHLLQLLHGQSTDSLGGWLRLEHAWLLGERVDALASRSSRLLLELQVQAAAKFEGTVLLQLGSGQLHVVGDDGLHVLALHPSLLSNGAEGCGGSHGAAGLHGLHCL